MRLLALTLACVACSVAHGDSPQQVTTKPGMASSFVLNVQGNASGTPVPVSVSSATCNQGNAGSNAQAWWTQIGDTTIGPAAVKAASTAAVAADKALVCAISPNNTVAVTESGTWTVQPGNTANTTAWLFDLNKVGGTATVNGGLAGSLAVGGTAGNNAAITQNPNLIGVEALSSQPAAATTGNQRRLVGSLDGALYVRPNGPIIWTCIVSAQTVKRTCQASPGANLKLYVTDVYWTNNSATATSALLASGTGADCVTTTNNKTAAHTVPVSGAGSNVWLGGMTTPIAMNANEALCTVPGGANSYSATISGFTAP